MIHRFYVHNFRCLENFELPISSQPSLLLIGRNGSGKTTVALALEIFQKIGRGTNRVGELLKRKDFSYGRVDTPVALELEVKLGDTTYSYSIAFELPPEFKEPRVREEKFAVNGKAVYSRECAHVTLAKTGKDKESKFSIDWHLVALPIIQEPSSKDPFDRFKLWLRRMLILRPVPSLIAGDSDRDTLEPNAQGTDFGAWFAGLLAEMPSAYGNIDRYLRQLMPDLKDIKNPQTGTDSRSLTVQFSENGASVVIPFADLSNGEKCFMICALVLAANDAYGPILCFWDEPDNYLALQEVGHFVLALRRAFQEKGQFIATSQNPEAIRRFSGENTLLLARKSHLAPTTVRLLSELSFEGNLVGAMIRGDLE